MSNHWTILCMAWSKLVFGENIQLLTPKIRTMRLLEEALELAQVEGVSRDEAAIITAQVYNKPKGDPGKELGGVLVTTSAYAGTRGWDLEQVFMMEFTRIMDPAIMDRVRNRNLLGDKIGFDRPGQGQRPVGEPERLTKRDTNEL